MVRHPPRQMPEEGSVVTFDSVPEVTRVEDLFALAVAMERQAAERYRALAEEMEAEGENALAGLFRRLEQAEADHESGIAAWAARSGIRPSRHLSFNWDSPEGPSEGDLGTRASAWKALAVAVRNEERAFAAYSNMAAKTTDPAVQHYAERMAAEELEHVIMLRLERRRAWRGEDHARQAALPAAGPPDGRDVASYRAYVAAAEAEAAARLRSKARAAQGPGAPIIAAALEEMAHEARGRAGGQSAPPLARVPPSDATALMRDEESRLGRLYDATMHVIETSRDEAVLRAAQDETVRILARLAKLRDLRARLAAGF